MPVWLRRRSFAYGLAVLLALALAAVWLLMIAEERNISENTAQRLELEALTADRIAGRLRETQSLLEAVRHNREQMDYFRQTFLQRKEARVVGISRFLEERARARRLRLDEVRYQSGRVRQGDDLETYHMDLPLTGRYRDLRDFIDDIESSDMFLMITRLEVRDHRAGDGAVQVDLSLATFFEGAAHGE